MSRIKDRLSSAWRGRGGRWRVTVAGAVAALVAVGVGVWWGMAGAGEPGSGSAGAERPLSGASPGAAPGGALPGTVPPAAPGDGDPLGGGGVGGPAPGSGAGSGTGSGAGSSGGSAGNRAPVIGDPGLSSDGLTLTVAPTVTDPDGDEVTLSIIVDGEVAPFNAMGSDSEFVSHVRFDHAEVEFTHTAVVEIVATDSQGATSGATFTHDLAAVTTVTVRDVTFRLQAPALCFGTKQAQRLEADLRLTGAATAREPISEELRPDLTTVLLLDRVAGEVSGRAASQQINLTGATLAGAKDSASFSHNEPVAKLHRLFEGTPCRGYFTYKISFAVR